MPFVNRTKYIRGRPTKYQALSQQLPEIRIKGLMKMILAGLRQMGVARLGLLGEGRGGKWVGRAGLFWALSLEARGLGKLAASPWWQILWRPWWQRWTPVEVGSRPAPENKLTSVWILPWSKEGKKERMKLTLCSRSIHSCQTSSAKVCYCLGYGQWCSERKGSLYK